MHAGPRAGQCTPQGVCAQDEELNRAHHDAVGPGQRAGQCISGGGGGLSSPGGGGRGGWHKVVSGGRGGVDTALWLDPPRQPQKGSIDAPPPPPPPNAIETDPRDPEVTRTPDSAKRENGIVGISASRGFIKVIFCHVFSEKTMVKKFCGGAFGARVHSDLLMVLSTEPFSRSPPPPLFGGSTDPPPHPRK